MSIPPGYHKIKSYSGKYLTLPTQGGIVTAMPATGASNQIVRADPWLFSTTHRLLVGLPNGRD